MQRTTIAGEGNKTRQLTPAEELFQKKAHIGYLGTAVLHRQAEIRKLQENIHAAKEWVGAHEQPQPAHDQPIAVIGNAHEYALTPVSDLAQSELAKELLGNEGIGWRILGQLPESRSEVLFQVSDFIRRSSDVILQKGIPLEQAPAEAAYNGRLDRFAVADAEMIVTELEAGLASRGLTLQGEPEPEAELTAEDVTMQSEMLAPRHGEEQLVA